MKVTWALMSKDPIFIPALKYNSKLFTTKTATCLYYVEHQNKFRFFVGRQK